MNKVTININILCSLMKDEIICNLNCAGVFHIKRSGTKNVNTKFTKKSTKQMLSLLADDIALYSSSTYDFEIVACFLHFQEIRDKSRNVH